MRQFQILAFLILMFNSCSSQDYSVETKLFDCLSEKSKVIGIDLKNELTDFEEHLLRSGVLKDNSGQSYYNLFEIIKETGEINFAFQYSLIDSFKSNSESVEFIDLKADCLNLEEKTEHTKKYKRSKLNKLKVGMDSIRNVENINTSDVAKVILRVLDPKDFEHNYYKMTALLMLATMRDIDLDVELELIRKLPTLNLNEKEIIEKRNLILLCLTADNDSVKVNNMKVSIEDLPDIVARYINSDSNDTSMPWCRYILI